MSFGLEQEGGSFITPMALAHPPHPINSRSRNKRQTCGLDDVFPSDDLCSRSETLCWYIFIYTYAFFIRLLVIRRKYTYTGSVVQFRRSYTPSQSIGLFLGVRGSYLECHLLPSFVHPIVFCFMMIKIIVLVTIDIRFQQHFDTMYFAFCDLSPPTMFLSLGLLSECRIQHGTIGPFYVTSRNSTRKFYGEVSRFATDCPCGVWCRGLITGLLYVGPHFGNWLWKNNWAVGLTRWTVNLHYVIGILTYLVNRPVVHIFTHTCL